MDEIKQRKKSVEDINNRIEDAIIVKKTRMKKKKTTEDNSQPDTVDKEKQLRDLLQESKDLLLQSD